MPTDVILQGALFADGTVGEVSIVDGSVASDPVPAADRIDLDGRLLLPALAEPHAHLDKAFLADRFPNPSGDLGSAIEAILRGWSSVDESDIEVRATTAVRRYLAAGTTAIRTHVDLNPDSGLKSVNALVRVRDRLRDLVDIQVAALATGLSGLDGDVGRSLLKSSIEAGIDVLGSCPNIEEEPIRSIETTLRAAQDSGLPVDLHLDEFLDPHAQHLEALAEAVDRYGLGGRVTASHCVSHGLLEPAEQRRIGRVLAAAGVAVVTNPRTNLFLQARGVEQAPARGLAGVAALIESGVLVAGGADNVQDPFNVIGRCDPLETASLLVTVAHRTVPEALAMVTSQARAVMGMPVPGFEPGAPGDFVAVAAGSVREAIAEQSADRIVIRGGRMVARTTVDGWVADA